jgi:hypothetical protein
MRSVRRLAIAALLLVMVGAAAADAQVLIVTHAPAGRTVELFVNTTAAGTATADAEGTARVPFTLPAGRSELEANLYIDVCDQQHRVLIVDRERAPLPEAAGCRRRSDVDVFVIRTMSTLVVDAGSPNFTVMLREGEFNPLVDALPATAPRGLLVSGSGGFGNFNNQGTRACGQVAAGTPNSFRFAYAIDGTYWITHIFGAEVTILRPFDATVHGSGETYLFDSKLKSEIVTVTGIVGRRARKARVFIGAGGSYHRAVTSTTESTTVQGAVFETQTIELTTKGWSWVVNGGVEVWFKRSLALYLKGGMTGIKGKDVGGGEGAIDDRLTFGLIGLRLRLGL